MNPCVSGFLKAVLKGCKRRDIAKARVPKQKSPILPEHLLALVSRFAGPSASLSDIRDVASTALIAKTATPTCPYNMLLRYASMDRADTSIILCLENWFSTVSVIPIPFESAHISLIHVLRRLYFTNLRKSDSPHLLWITFLTNWWYNGDN